MNFIISWWFSGSKKKDPVLRKTGVALLASTILHADAKYVNLRKTTGAILLTKTVSLLWNLLVDCESNSMKSVSDHSRAPESSFLLVTSFSGITCALSWSTHLILNKEHVIWFGLFAFLQRCFLAKFDYGEVGRALQVVGNREYSIHWSSYPSLSISNASIFKQQSLMWRRMCITVTVMAQA